MFLGVELEKIPVGVRNITLIFDDFTVTVIVPSHPPHISSITLLMYLFPISPTTALS
jgi:hypothetical protein